MDDYYYWPGWETSLVVHTRPKDDFSPSASAPARSPKFLKSKKKIYGLKVIKHNSNQKKTTFMVVCNSGTYVRSLANDIAISLKTFCYCTKIIRLRDGIFSKKN